jgi:acyl-CoA reductase-like NAD-dependent aldehyde dehydrogenase
MNAHVDTIHNFIGGQFVAPHAGAFLDSYRPATGRAYLRVPDSDARDVDQAVIAAEKAFETWSRTSPDERAEMLERIADVLASKLDAFAEAESCDQGKPVSLAKTVDIPRSIYNFRFFAKECHNFGKGETRTVYVNTTRGTGTTTGALSYTQYVPAGVAGLISPWNLPLYLLTWKIAPCLAAGCTCVCKPSELTSLTAYSKLLYRKQYVVDLFCV